MQQNGSPMDRGVMMGDNGMQSVMNMGLGDVAAMNQHGRYDGLGPAGEQWAGNGNGPGGLGNNGGMMNMQSNMIGGLMAVSSVAAPVASGVGAAIGMQGMGGMGGMGFMGGMGGMQGMMPAPAWGHGYTVMGNEGH